MSLDFHYSFGFRNSNKNFAFYNENVVLFAVGKFCVLFDLDSKVQKQFQFAECVEISAVAKFGILVAGAIKGKPSSICLLNMLSETKKFYQAPPSMTSDEFTCVSVSVNLKFVAAQGALPDWLLVIWLSQNREVIATFRPAGNPECSVRDISFQEGGRDELVVVGRGVFKLYEFLEENQELGKPPFEEHVFDKFEKTENLHAIGWPEKENLAVSTSNGKILFFRGIEFVDDISVADDAKEFLSSEITDVKDVTSLLITAQQLVCVFGGFAALVYIGEEIGRYSLAKSISLSPESLTRSLPGEMREEPDSLVNVLISPNSKDIVATTRDGQMLLCREFSEGEQRQHFTSLLQRQHNDCVIAMDIARGRPVIATCSNYVVILWNYVDKKQELRKAFKDKMIAVAVHPTGLYLAVGFDRCCRIFSVLYRDFAEKAYISSTCCHGVRFSSGGHLLAVVSGSIVEIYCFFSLSLLFKLDGHAGVISSLAFNESDTKLFSCDVRGVICEWDLVCRRKSWEITAILAYLTLSVCPRTENVIAVGSDNSIRCFRDSSLLWILYCSMEATCAVFCHDDKAFRVGTASGCLVCYSCPESTDNTLVHAHNGRVSGVKYNSKYDILVSFGSDGSVFLWKASEIEDSGSTSIFSNLSLIGYANLAEQKKTLKQLSLSFQHLDTASDCEFELSCVRHEGDCRTMALLHEQRVDDLNEKIMRIKEDKQNILFDSDPKEDRRNLELTVRHEIIDTTFKLNDTYKKSNEFAHETQKIILNYENSIDALSEKHAKFSCSERNVIEEITARIKALEDNLVLEKEITRHALVSCDEYKNRTEREILQEASAFRRSQEDLLGEQESQAIQLQCEVERLQQLTSLKAQDTKNRRNITSGQVDYDLREKVNAITLLKEDFRKLESIVDSKEKLAQKQEKKFGEMRKFVGNFQKYYSVSNTAIDELLEKINSEESKIESCRKEIKNIEISIPQIQKEISGIEDLCSTVTEKLGDLVDTYQKKEKILRETQEVISKYMSMLHLSATKECQPFSFVQDVLELFNSCQTGLIEEVVDSNLLNEYESQIDKLKRSYDLIKGEPPKAMRNKSMGEFRLSQENTKILQEVHEIQKDAERLRTVIHEMETALGVFVVKSSKKADDMRDRVEFIIEAHKRDKMITVRQLAQLDTFIEEQQREIERFQTMLSAKEKAN